MILSPNGLSGFLSPAGIAVIGGSPDMSRAGGRVLRYLSDYGYEGGIYPVNSKYEEIGDRPCYAGIKDVPDPVDLAMICVSAPHVPEVVRDCATRGLKAVIVHSDGFGDMSGPGLGGELRAAWEGTGMRMIGPNTNGIRIPEAGVMCDASTGLPLTEITPTPVALLTQSGGIGSYFGSIFMQQRGVGCRYLIDTGNELDVDTAEWVTHLSGEEDLRAIGLILESCPDGRRLVEAVRHATKAGKRVLILKLATQQASIAAAASHTGAIAGRFDVFSQILAEAGARICHSPRHFVEALALCGRGTIPAGPGVGVVTGSGGFGVLATDIGERFGLTFPQPTVPATDAMRKYLARASFANPTDLSAQGQTPDKTLAAGIEFLASQPNLDCVIAMQPHSLLHPRLSALIMSGLIEGAASVKVPIFVCGMASEETKRELWDKARITAFESPDDLLAAIALVAGQPEDEEKAVKAPNLGTSDALVGAPARALLDGVSGLELVREATLASEAEAQAFASKGDQKVVLKVQVPGLAHKSEYGFVIGPVTPDAVAGAYCTLVERRKASGFEGQITAEAFEEGVEIALGTFVDASFGPVVMVGAGGRLVELLDDVSFAPAPVTLETAHRIIHKLKAYALLKGYRGSKPADVDALAEAVVALSRLVTRKDFTHAEIDINPIIVRAQNKGAVAVDYVLA